MGAQQPEHPSNWFNPQRKRRAEWPASFEDAIACHCRLVSLQCAHVTRWHMPLIYVRKRGDTAQKRAPAQSPVEDQTPAIAPVSLLTCTARWQQETALTR